MIKERLENLFKKKNIETTIKEKEEVLGIEYFINKNDDRAIRFKLDQIVYQTSYKICRKLNLVLY